MAGEKAPAADRRGNPILEEGTGLIAKGARGNRRPDRADGFAVGEARANPEDRRPLHPRALPRDGRGQRANPRHGREARREGRAGPRRAGDVRHEGPPLADGGVKAKR